jgi:hypothetical protein
MITPNSSDDQPPKDRPNSSHRTQDNIPASSAEVERLGITLEHPDKSILRRWLRAFATRNNAPPVTNPDVSWRRRKRWEKIGWEVFERKALLLGGWPRSARVFI